MPTESGCWPLVRSTYVAAAFGRLTICCLAYLCDLVPALFAPAMLTAEFVAAIGFRAFVPSAFGKGPSPSILAAMIAQLEASLTQAKDESIALRARADAVDDARRRDHAALSERLVAVDRSSATLHATTNDMARAALRITTETTIVSVAAEDAFRKVSEIAGLGQDFVEMISHISDMSERSTAMGRDVVLQTETTSATIDDLLDATDEIGALTTLIAGIAHQTNLLALNATIEAARAGAHGRGFAIVASEVKSLAQETAKAAATIAAMAEAIRASSDKSIVAIKSIGGSIHGLNEATADIARSVAERVEAAASLSNSISETATNVGFVSASINKIESAVDETIQGTQFLREVAAGIAAESVQIDVLLRSGDAGRHFSAADPAAA